MLTRDRQAKEMRKPGIEVEGKDGPGPQRNLVTTGNLKSNNLTGGHWTND